MRKESLHYLICILLGCLLLSLPWLLPHSGWTALLGFVPLLVMDRLAQARGTRRFFWWYYLFFVLWNAVTTWWVGMATVGGAVFAIAANAFQMALIFGAFRLVKRRLKGALPYIFLAAAWIAWEKFYLTSAQISWPWLVLGNAFADTTGLVQWYEFTGSLGGSLWIWAANLSVFGLMCSLSDGSFSRRGIKARSAAISGVILAFFGPMIASAFVQGPREDGETLNVAILQPNLDPYMKEQSLTTAQQDQIILSQLVQACSQRDTSAPLLVLGPETMTRDSGIWLEQGSGYEAYHYSFPSYEDYRSTVAAQQGVSLVFGAVVRSYHRNGERNNGYRIADMWLYHHNAALLVDGSSAPLGDRVHIRRFADTEGDIPPFLAQAQEFRDVKLPDCYYKSKLVPGVEMMPYPKVIGPINRLVGDPCGKDVGEGAPACLPLRLPDGREIPLGVAVCYESVYGEHCAGYVAKGAQLLCVITNDAWWGTTPGYRQHLNMSRLRAIETRRYVARCGNTGISGVIDPEGRILSKSAWWHREVLDSEVKLLQGETFFVRAGDIVGRLSVFVFLLLVAATLISRFRK